jgi:hypothetical protein
MAVRIVQKCPIADRRSGVLRLAGEDALRLAAEMACASIGSAQE